VSSLTVLQEELDWVPLSSEDGSSTTTGPQGLERKCWVAARSDEIEVRSVSSARQLCALSMGIGYRGSDDAADGEEGSEEDPDHVKEGQEGKGGCTGG
jgi:hypothetical protein